MYTILPLDTLKFLSTDFMPVRRITSDPGAGQPYKAQFDTQAAAAAGQSNRLRLLMLVQVIVQHLQ